MTVLLKSNRGDIDWEDMTETIHKCARDASAANHTYFGIEFFGECWIHPNMTSFDNSSLSIIPDADCLTKTYLGTGGEHKQCIYKIV